MLFPAILVGFLIWLLAALPTAAVAYLGLLTLLSGKVKPPAEARRTLRFVLLIPAHDEAGEIADTLRSCDRIDWPPELRRILVVADNCTDGTAAIAESHGADVVTRNDTAHRGKGYALATGYARIIADGWADAVVVMDADSRPDPKLFTAFAARIETQAEAIQCFHGVANPQRSWRTRLMTIALAIFHRLRSRGRERLGLSCGLRGNGMCFTTALLARVPHQAHTIVEDLEYGIQLGLAGVRVHYADEAEVLAEMPVDASSATSQRQRWEGGRARFARDHAPALFAAAMHKRSAMLLDLGLDLIIPPLSTIALATAGLLGLSIALAAHGVTGWHAATLPIVGTIILGAHIIRGVQLSGLGSSAWFSLMTAPFYVVWKIGARYLAPSAAQSEWVRTQRERESGKTR